MQFEVLFDKHVTNILQLFLTIFGYFAVIQLVNFQIDDYPLAVKSIKLNQIANIRPLTVFQGQL